MSKPKTRQPSFVAGHAGQPGADLRQLLWRAQHPNGPAAPTWGAPPKQRFVLVANVYNRGGPGTGLEISLGGAAIESGQVTVHSLEVANVIETQVATPIRDAHEGGVRLRAEFPFFSIVPKPGVEGGADYDTEATFLATSDETERLASDIGLLNSWPAGGDDEVPREALDAMAGIVAGIAHQLTLRVQCQNNSHFENLPMEVVVTALGLPESECRQEVLVEASGRAMDA